MHNPDQKTSILFASVLKPVDEPRMCERMGLSLANHGFEVFIAGFPPSSGKSINGITFLPHEKFKRISIARIKVRFRILKKAFVLKPDILIITTHELIGIALLFKFLTGKKIVYDVQEDYWQNIIHTNTWPKIMRPLLAFPVRWKEWIASSFFSKFLLAEKCYADLGFARGKSVVIENKCVLNHFQRKPLNEVIQLIFTGTIADSTGIFEAIHLAKNLNQREPNIRLTIVGQSAQSSTLHRIKNEIAQCSFIEWIGGSDFVPHDRIIEAISSADFGIISYPHSPHTKNKIPSKLYEYLACQLPILLQANTLWEDLCAPCHAAIAVDFENPNIDSTLLAMRNGNFFTVKAEGANWDNAEPLLLTTIRSLR